MIPGDLLTIETPAGPVQLQVTPAADGSALAAVCPHRLRCGTCRTVYRSYRTDVLVTDGRTILSLRCGCGGSLGPG